MVQTIVKKILFQYLIVNCVNWGWVVVVRPAPLHDGPDGAGVQEAEQEDEMGGCFLLLVT